MEGITASSNDLQRSPHTDVTDQRPSQNENRLDASYELIGECGMALIRVDNV
jgi:hypothetical protein